MNRKTEKGRPSAVTSLMLVLGASLFFSCSSAGAEAPGVNDGRYIIEIEAGAEWLHDFKLFLGFNKMNPPQYAIWLEDADGNYLETIVVTEKLAKESWVFNGGNRRVEALPYWMFSHGKIYSDGFMLPSGNEPLPDAVTAASAAGSSVLGFTPEASGEVGMIRIVAEFNHSTDFNPDWPEDAAPGETGYSGGSMGSGQPAVVYMAEFDPEEMHPGDSIELKLAGRSSADGSDGELYSDLSGLTSALRIVESVRLVCN